MDNEAAKEQNRTRNGTAPGRRTRAKRLPPAVRRAQIVQTAIRVLADHGLGHTNQSQVAAAAGVSLPSLSSYFSSPEELALAVVDEVARFLIDDIIKPTLGDRSEGGAVIEEVLMAFAQSIDTHRDYARIWLDWSTSVRGKVWQRFLLFNWEATGLVRDAIKKGQMAGHLRSDVDAGDAAHVVVGLGHMIAQMVFAGVPRTQVAQTIRSLVRGYLGT